MVGNPSTSSDSLVKRVEFIFNGLTDNDWYQEVLAETNGMPIDVPILRPIKREHEEVEQNGIILEEVETNGANEDVADITDSSPTTVKIMNVESKSTTGSMELKQKKSIKRRSELERLQDDIESFQIFSCENQKKPVEPCISWQVLNYCLSKTTKLYDCKLCSTVGMGSTDIITHYKTYHPQSEVMISRLSVEQAKDAVRDASEHNYECENAVNHSNMLNKGVNFCRFCEAPIRTTNTEALYLHFAKHTGEYRWQCPSERCGITFLTIEDVREHISWNHNTEDGDRPFLLVREVFPLPPLESVSQMFGYLCSACNYVQLIRLNVEQHVSKQHAMMNLPINIIKVTLHYIKKGLTITKPQGQTLAVQKSLNFPKKQPIPKWMPPKSVNILPKQIHAMPQKPANAVPKQVNLIPPNPMNSFSIKKFIHETQRVPNSGNSKAANPLQRLFAPSHSLPKRPKINHATERINFIKKKFWQPPLKLSRKPLSTQKTAKFKNHKNIKKAPKNRVTRSAVVKEVKKEGLIELELNPDTLCWVNTENEESELRPIVKQETNLIPIKREHLQDIEKELAVSNSAKWVMIGYEEEFANETTTVISTLKNGNKTTIDAERSTDRTGSEQLPSPPKPSKFQKCATCSFRSLPHIVKIHEEHIHNDFALICKYCQKKFYSAIELKSHENDTHDWSESLYLDASSVWVVELTHTCYECAHQEDTYGDITNHLQSHSLPVTKWQYRDLMYTCPYCKQEFPNKNDVINHWSQNHKPSLNLVSVVKGIVKHGVGAFRCPQCTFSCWETGVCEEHVISVHYNITRCRTCQCLFDTTTSLDIHCKALGHEPQSEVDPETLTLVKSSLLIRQDGEWVAGSQLAEPDPLPDSPIASDSQNL